MPWMNILSIIFDGIYSSTLNNLPTKIKQYGTLILSTLLLLIPAFYNHYPIVNPDTATYLASGFKPETPFDRPITYGLLARLFSINGFSLWLVIFAQAYIVVWLIFRNINALLNTQRALLYTIITALFLSLLTPLSWVVSQVQPDIFTSIACLCIPLILCGKETRGNQITLYFLFLIAVAAHMSHPILFVGVCLLLFVMKNLYERNSKMKVTKKLITIAVLSLLSILSMGSAMSKSRHVFFIASLLEKGVLKTYLDENCASKNYKICAYKDVLPKTLDEFLWFDSSPLYKIGDWAGTKPEFNAITKDVLTTPKYLGMYLSATAKKAGVQTLTNNIGDGNTAFPPKSNVENRVREYFPKEARAFNQSKQNTNGISLAGINHIFTAVLIMGLIIIIVGCIKWKRLSAVMKTFIVVIIVSMVCNIADCAAFTEVNGRYGCKMIWLIPFTALLLIMNMLNNNKHVWRSLMTSQG